jgi:predicted enzyme related to lactoylglutathione lyase
MPAKVTRSSYVLAVHDLGAMTAYWRDVLGWVLEFEDSGNWTFLFRDHLGVHLGECKDAMPASALGDHSYFAYIVFDDLDAYHTEISARGALIGSPPTDKPWGMREMVVRTPEGHRIMFAQDLN